MATMHVVVSDKDRAHFRVIAEAMDRMNREDLERAARLSPGEKIEEGLRLSRCVPQPYDQHRPDPVAPIVLWRRLGKVTRA